MKWNTIFGSLVLGASMCSYSSAGLLDRMLGCSNTGCDTACCDTVVAEPTCGCEMAGGCNSGCGAVEPTCGVEMSPCGDSSCGGGCEPTCGVEMSSCGGGCEPTCGVEMSACGGGCAGEPSCGVEVAKSCKPRKKPILGLLKKLQCKAHAACDRIGNIGKRRGGCDSGCGAIEPTCGCEMAGGCNSGCGAVEPTCGVEISGGCNGGCGSIDPTCGVEMAACGDSCDSGCGLKKRVSGGLLGKLFKKRGSSCCDSMGCDSYVAASDCGCNSAAPVAAPAPAAAAPAPTAAPAQGSQSVPAPVVDPSAYLQSKRRVIQASTVLN